MKHRAYTGKRHDRRMGSFRFTPPVFIMSAAYLIGCILGARIGVLSEFPESVVSVLTDAAAETSPVFLSVLGNFGFYGLVFLLLSTSYLGFCFVPLVLFVKGFVSGTVFLSYLQSGQQNSYLLAVISICLPGIFALPALLLLGKLCMQLSFQLLCRLRGAPPVDSEALYRRSLAAVAVLMLAAAVIESYVVPPLLKMVST